MVGALNETVEDPLPLRKEIERALEEMLNAKLPANEPLDVPPNPLHGLDNTVLDYLDGEVLKWLIGTIEAVLGDPEVSINIVINIALPPGKEVIIMETE